MMLTGFEKNYQPPPTPPPVSGINANLTELRGLCRAVSSPKFGGGAGGGCPNVRVSSVFSLILPPGGETKYLRMGCSRQLHSLNLVLMRSRGRKRLVAFVSEADRDFCRTDRNSA